MEIQIILLFSIIGGGAANGLVTLQCVQNSYVCDGEEVDCSCTAHCDVMHWWYGKSSSRCRDSIQYDSNVRNDGGVTLKVTNSTVDCPNSCVFTSRLKFNLSNDLNSTVIQIGCSIAQPNSIGSVINGDTCIPMEPTDLDRNSNITLRMINCTALKPPRNLNLDMGENAQCNSSMNNIRLTWEEPEPEFPVSHYNLCYTTGERGNCSEVLPGNVMSFDLLAEAGTLYTVTASAVINQQESQNNPHLKFVIVGVTDQNTTANDATIQLQYSDAASKFTISYGLCSTSEAYTRISFVPPVVHLASLTAETIYCYQISVTGNESDRIVIPCNGTFTTAEAQPAADIGVIVGAILGALTIIIGVIAAIIVSCC